MNRRSVLPALQNGSFVLLTGAALFLGAQLSAPSSAVKQTPSSDQFESTQQRLEVVNAKLEALEQIGFVTEEAFRIRELTLQEQIDALNRTNEQSADVQALRRDLGDLAEQVQLFDTRLQALKYAIDSLRPLAASPAAASTPRPSQPKVITNKPAPLPFNILGVESRGGVMFLAVAATGMTRLDDVELMRVTGSYLGWRLDALLPDTARFRRSDGSSHNVTIN
ncbi:hypothetical protein MHB_0003620 [Pseudomonas fluorescens BBc6R8]|uniref:hypothetical protein n=1 Tax=Pseudomonas fluorescens TaxID=294 RepID=UPI000281C8CF|nr:hypothetical protein [Pseudomonas fluorescens]QQD55377.1 hypothetical protein MHB_0003620 [Pseudomonas fluorescens BBc6R8]